jgi:hypothetical protein
MEILPVGAELFHAVERTDGQRNGETNSHFQNFANARRYE